MSIPPENLMMDAPEDPVCDALHRREIDDQAFSSMICIYGALIAASQKDHPMAVTVIICNGSMLRFAPDFDKQQPA